MYSELNKDDDVTSILPVPGSSTPLGLVRLLAVSIITKANKDDNMAAAMDRATLHKARDAAHLTSVDEEMAVQASGSTCGRESKEQRRRHKDAAPGL